MCVCLRPSTVKALSVWSWDSKGQINDVGLNTFLTSAKSLHRYFSVKHRAFLVSLFILFTHQKQAKSRINQLCMRLAFKVMRPSATIIRHLLWSTIQRELICLLHQYSQERSQSNYEKLKQLQISVLNPVLGKVLKTICLF